MIPVFGYFCQKHGTSLDSKPVNICPHCLHEHAFGPITNSANYDDLDGWIWNEITKTYDKPGTGEKKNDDERPKIRCECGVDSVGAGRHSSYCPKYTTDT
jgi:hypothetical protein